MRPDSAIPEAAMMIAGPWSVLSRFESSTSRVYCTSEKSKIGSLASISRSVRSKISGCTRKTAVASMASGLSMNTGRRGIFPSWKSWFRA